MHPFVKYSCLAIALSMLCYLPYRAIDIIVLISIPSILTLSHSKGIKNVITLPAIILFLFFFLWTLVPRDSLPMANNFLWSAYVTRLFFVVIFCQYIFSAKKNLEYLLSLLSLLIIPIFTLGILYVFFNIKLFAINPVYSTNLRLCGFGNANYLAYILGITLVAKLSSIGAGGSVFPNHVSLRSMRRYEVPITVVTIISFLWTGSRGAIIAVVFSQVFVSIPFLLTLFLGRRAVIKTFYIWIILLVTALLSWMLFLDKSILLNILRIENLLNSTGSGRDLIWANVLTQFDFYSLTAIWGHGAGSAWSSDTSMTGALQGTHNDYIWILYDYGIVGLTMFISLNIAALAKLIALRNFQLASCLVFSLTYSLTNDIVNTSLYALLVGICIASYSWNRGKSALDAIH